MAPAFYSSDLRGALPKQPLKYRPTLKGRARCWDYFGREKYPSYNQINVINENNYNMKKNNKKRIESCPVIQFKIAFVLLGSE